MNNKANGDINRKGSCDENAFAVSIGRRVKYYRKRAGITQADMARHVNISHHQWQKNERGINPFPASRLVQIKNLLKLDSYDLLFLDDIHRKKNEKTKTNTLTSGKLSNPLLQLSSVDKVTIRYEDSLTKEEMQLVTNLRFINEKKIRNITFSLIKAIRLLSQRPPEKETHE